MGLGGVAIAVLPSMIYPKQPFSDGLGGANLAEDSQQMYPEGWSRPRPKDGGVE